jgi:4a-hydroxytetrahydrobiopterin dehydratase
MQLKFSKGQDESKVTADVNALVESGWELDEEQIGVQKTYHFKTYTKVMVGDSTNYHGLSNLSKDLHHNIGVRSKSKNHHPEMISVSFRTSFAMS